ncbi:methyltransferase domain-containing protein [Desulfurispirillum indicum]|uniref:tRNA (guanine(46)-N(7))-methyltransferase TrmB n=1 Tax=Desulfurispirillum indicum TaxID=936456 RepID=UPI001CFBC1B9|nr:methyltransferase domain-containing protein [Desulfurispirillum indicum]UCZ57819.1 methyltransferase domain-containing protein [Desulfurispirillum indicum]
MSSSTIEVNPYVRKIHEFPETILVPGEDGRFALFPQLRSDMPVVVEIGSGSGNHMIQYLTRMPRCQYFGYELRYKRLYRTAQKLAEAKQQGYVVQCFAQKMPEHFAPASIDALIINFPDPWAKLKQRKNRIMAPQNLKIFHSLLKPGGVVEFKSDHHEYFLRARENLLDSGFAVEAYTLNLHGSAYSADNIITEFERMFLHKVPKRIGWLRARKVG